ncbi:hypothetical protein [Streptomyces sp. NPDC059631]|uniref:hypothetical protein n=1 Tax=unclassified Streptomyces TaxID=2593676 RepID=UPI003685BBA6
MKTFVWDDTFRWSGVVYAPQVPLRERRHFVPDGGLSPYTLRYRRFRNRWGGRAILHDDLGNSGTQRIKEVQRACEGVWRAARQFADMVDLIELEHRLSEELWICAQLQREIRKMMMAGVEGGFATRAAEETIEGQIVERQQHLNQLKEEYEALYYEVGADPAVMTDAIGEALTRAQAFGDARPIHDAVIWTRSLREIIVRGTKAGEEERLPKP